jgi:hypothetical protein
MKLNRNDIKLFRKACMGICIVSAIIIYFNSTIGFILLALSLFFFLHPTKKVMIFNKDW